MFLSPLMYNFGFFLPNLELMTPRKKQIIQNFEKLPKELDLAS